MCIYILCVYWSNVFVLEYLYWYHCRTYVLIKSNSVNTDNHSTFFGKFEQVHTSQAHQ